MAAHGDREFAARQDRDALALGAGLERKAGMLGGDVAGFAFEIGAEVNDLVAGVLGEFDSRVERSLRARDQLEMRARKGAVAFLAAFVAGVIERAANRVVDLKAVF